MKRSILHGMDFGRALVDHFKLPGDQVDADVAVSAGSADIFAVTLKIALTADDLTAIAQRMPGAAKPPESVRYALAEVGDAGPEWSAYFDRLLSTGIYERKAGPCEIGFDAWMRQRTDRAHTEYMASHAAGGIAYT